MQFYDSLSHMRRRVLRGIATTPGLLLPGITLFDGWIHLPLQPLYLEHVYRHKDVWELVTEFALSKAEEQGVEVVAGAEAAGIPLASSMALRGPVSFAYIRRRGYVGHVKDEPPIRGSDVGNKRVMLVEDAIWTGRSLRGFIESIQESGGLVVGAFSIIDMRQLSPDSWVAQDNDAWMPARFDYCGTYYELLDAAVDCQVMTPDQRELVRRFGEEVWTQDHPDWHKLDTMRLNIPSAPML